MNGNGKKPLTDGIHPEQYSKSSVTKVEPFFEIDEHGLKRIAFEIKIDNTKPTNSIDFSVSLDDLETLLNRLRKWKPEKKKD